MSDVSKYISGAGPYPVAPNTSVSAYMDTRPDLYSDWWQTVANIEANGGMTNNLNIYYKDWSRFHRDYESWKMQKTNEYNALLKDWQVAQNSPLSQSEYLEAAGYNRNWLQGGVNTPVETAPYAPMQSEQKPIDPFGNIIGFVGSLVQIMQQGAQYYDTIAGAELKQSQAARIDAVSPLDQLLKELTGAEQYSRLYGDPSNPLGGVGVHQLNSGQMLELSLPDAQSYSNKMLRLNLQSIGLQNTFRSLSVDEQRYYNKELQPLQKIWQDKMNSFLQGTIDFQQMEKQVRDASQSFLVEHSKDFALQKWLKGWVDIGSEVIGSLVDIVSPFKGLFGKNKGIRESYDGNGELKGVTISK